MVFEQVLILAIFIAIGYIVAKLGIVRSEHRGVLSSLLVYVFGTANIFKSFASNFNRTYLSENYSLVLISTAIMAVLSVIAFFAAKIFSRNAFEQKVFEYSMVCPNYGYMGYALAEALFGSLGLTNFVVFSIPFSVYIYTYGFAILTKRGINLKKLINPVTVSMVLGIIVGLLEIPVFEIEVIYTVVDRASSCMAPISMLLAGIVISEFKLKELFSCYKIYILAAVSLIVTPLTIGGIVSLFGNDTLTAITVLFYSLPCGLNTVVFPSLIGEDCKLGAGIALVTTIIGCATLPLMFMIFGLA